MHLPSFGDLAANYRTQKATGSVKTDLERLSQELASGRKTDLATAVSRDFGPVAGLERVLAAQAAFATATREAATVGTVLQDALDVVQSNAIELGQALISTVNSNNPEMVEGLAADARFRLDSMLAKLNVRVGDQALLSGVATDQTPFASADEILADLAAASAAAGATDAAGVLAVVDDWFDTPGGGFETIAYRGSDQPRTPVRLSENDSAALTVTGLDSRLREVLKGVATAALVSEGVLAGQGPETTALVSAAGEQLLSADQGLATLRTEVGAFEATAERVGVENAAATSAAEIARNELVAIDPYRAATDFEAARAQLETIYTLTARLSQLSLTGFLR